MRRFVVFAALLAGCFCHAQTTGTAQVLTMHVNGYEITFTVNDRDLKGSPVWSDPDHVPPPVSIADAIALSKAELWRYKVEHVEDWYVSTVAIHRFDEQPLWFYTVEWRSKTKHMGDGIDVPVLMTGKAVVGTIRRDADSRSAGSER